MQVTKLFFVVGAIEASTSGAGAAYKLHENMNVVEGTDQNNASDLVGCTATGNKDVRKEPEEMQKCLDQCSSNSQCVGVTFHSMGTMLKQAVEGKTIDQMMKERTGFQTYVKPSASSCYFSRFGWRSLDARCQKTCGNALEDGFLAGKGDSTDHGHCCWNNCAEERYQLLIKWKYTCYCDGSEPDSDQDQSLQTYPFPDSTTAMPESSTENVSTVAPGTSDDASTVPAETSSTAAPGTSDDASTLPAETSSTAAPSTSTDVPTNSAPTDSSSTDTSDAGARYVLHNDKNVVEGSDTDNGSDLVGCQASGSKDVRNNQALKQECLDECTDNADCIAVTFHSAGTMLKKKADGKSLDDMLVDRSGFETYAKPDGSMCYSPSTQGHDSWCVSTCTYALQHGFLAGNGDSTANGNCCWNDCDEQLYNKQPYTCFCDGSTPSTTVLV